MSNYTPSVSSVHTEQITFREDDAYSAVSVATKKLVSRLGVAAQRLFTVVECLPNVNRKGWRGSPSALARAYREWYGRTPHLGRLRAALDRLVEAGAVVLGKGATLVLIVPQSCYVTKCHPAGDEVSPPSTNRDMSSETTLDTVASSKRKPARPEGVFQPKAATEQRAKPVSSLAFISVVRALQTLSERLEVYVSIKSIMDRFARHGAAQEACAEELATIAQQTEVYLRRMAEATP